MKIKRAKVIVPCVASHFQAANERIIEFSVPGPHGPIGGLISFRTTDKGMTVELYRLDEGVSVRTPHEREATP